MAEGHRHTISDADSSFLNDYDSLVHRKKKNNRIIFPPSFPQLQSFKLQAGEAAQNVIPRGDAPGSPMQAAILAEIEKKKAAKMTAGPIVLLAVP